MTEGTRTPHRTGGKLWGPERVRLGISLDQLAARTGLNKGMLSLMEHGRLIPSGDEYDKVMAALDKYRHPGNVA